MLSEGGNNATSLGGFSFGIFAPVGAIQPEEVDYQIGGLKLQRSNNNLSFRYIKTKRSTK
jgi:hypothetical protein